MGVTQKIALVTGASRGIGKAIAVRLAEDGYDVAVGYLMNEGPANAVVRSITEIGRRSLAIQGDVRAKDDLKRLVDMAAGELGGLDVVVDNAALGVLKPTLKIRVSKWDLTMESTLRPLLLLAQYAVPHFTARGGGRILALSSLGARRYLPGYAAIGSAKAALENLVRYLAVDLAPLNIRVNCLSGGPIDTDSLNYVMSEESDRAEVAAATPLGRIGTPEDLARVASFLCGPDSDWITGQTLVADGGLSLR
jgi:NAD(P)-dependent dehydrogenase (short-subunit alcohol dehydrogenase family)